MRAYAGRIFCLSDHLRRLEETCLSVGQPIEAKNLSAWLNESLQRSKHPNSLIRLSWHPLNEKNGKFVVIIRPFESYPEEIYQNGVILKTATQRRWTNRAQDSQLKTSQYVPSVLAYLENQTSVFRELIFFNEAGYVAEGSVSNIFLIKSKRLLTPEVGSGILRGVTRDFVISIAQKNNFKVQETVLTRHELYTADECFMTNTSSEILPVTEIDKRKIGSGRPGPLTQKLRKIFKKERLAWHKLKEH